LSLIATGSPPKSSAKKTKSPEKEKSYTLAQRDAAHLGAMLETVSWQTGSWQADAIGFASGVGAALAGVGEGPTTGLDTPVTVTFGSMTGFFGTASVATGLGASALNAFAAGNLASIRSFGWSHLTEIAAHAAASKIPMLHHWAETIGSLAEQVLN
jgi:hypothetical protein